jgi:hypothetical protein
MMSCIGFSLQEISGAAAWWAQCAGVLTLSTCADHRARRSGDSFLPYDQL